MKHFPYFKLYAKNIYMYILFVFVSFTSLAQPPCITNTPPGNDVCNATPICDFNGYCGSTPSKSVSAWQQLRNTVQSSCTAGFDNLTLDNDRYLKFVAGSNSMSLDVYVSNCKKPVTTKAIQMAVFSAQSCNSGAVDVKWCNLKMMQQAAPHNVNVGGLTPGETYYILIDGYSGQDCDFKIAAGSGISIGLSADIPQTSTLCAGQSVTVTASGGSGTYDWTGDSGLGSTSGATVTITPPSTPGIYNYKITSNGGTSLCPTSNEYDFSITVSGGGTPTFDQLGPVCAGTAFTLPTTSTNGITGTWAPAVNNTATTTYTFTPNGSGCAVPATMTVTIDNPTTPTFNQSGPFCAGTAFTLPTTSNNGITGTWMPAVNNNATTTYTFTPTGSGCVSPTTMTVEVNNSITPTFTNPGPICSGTNFTLPTTSNNGITGTWIPAVNSTQTTNYTFTPASGCANPITMTVEVNNVVTPTFTNPGPICAGTNFTLPATSNNGITGTWAPAVNSTQTTTYTFTPTSGGCTNPTTMTVEVDNSITPTFTNPGPICAGTAFTLPATSNNGITGTWTPVIDNIQTTTYTFNPSSGSGSCPATSVTMQVTVNPGPIADFIPSVTTGQSPLEVIFENTSVNASGYTWNFGNGESSVSSSPGISPVYNKNGTYEVILIASDGMCTDTAKTTIIVMDSELLIHVPNVFTPNGDNVNDVFFIGTVNAKTVYVEIFNRWGNLITKLENAADTWDGISTSSTSTSSVFATNGVYFYHYKITDFSDNLHEGHGFFHLER